MRLSQRDFRALLNFLRESYAERDVESFLTQLLSALPRLVPAMLVGCAEMNPRRRTSLNRFQPGGIATLASDRLWEQHMHEHPVLSYNRQTGDGQALKISDFLSAREFRRSALYNEVYRTMGVEDVLCFTLRAGSPAIIGMALHRERRSFTEQERRLLNLVRPHLIQAWRNATAFTEIQKRLASVEQALDLTDHGLIVLDRRGRPLLITLRARQDIRKYFGSANGVDRRLPEALERWIKHQLAFNGEKEVAQPRMPFVQKCSSDERLVIRLLTSAGQSLLLFEERKIGIDPARFAHLGLTTREAEILAWVACGKTNLEVASILGLSSRTVKKHLEHVFQKLGVETRTAAARLALENFRT